MDCNCTVTSPGPTLARCGGTTLSLFMLVLEHFLRTQCDIEDPCGQINPCTEPLPEYDFIVVGGGSAGCVIASRLSELPDWKVLLIEVGGNEPTSSQVPSFAFNAQNTSVDWQYYTEPEPTACLRTGGSCRMPRGKVIGGTSVLQRMYYCRGSRKNYDNWERLGNTGWSYEDVLPYFLKSEDNLLTDLVDSKYHGTGGYLPVTKFNYQYPIEEDIFKAAEELGFELGDYNGEHQTRFSYIQITSKNGIRYSTSRAFLRPVMDRSNLHILLDTSVTRVVVDPKTKQANGVDVITSQGLTKTFFATKEVILCGGTINSPQILLLLGIGDEEELKRVDIPVVHHLPGVGKNLQNHLAFFISSYVNETDSNYLTWASAMEYLLFRRGPLSTVGTSVNGFIHTKYSNVEEDYPDVRIQFLGYSARCSQTGIIGEIDGEVICGVLPKRNVGFDTNLYRPRSKGYLTLRDNNPLSHPKIYPKYLTAPEDIVIMIEGIKVSLQLSQTKALQKYGFELDRSPIKGCEDKTFGTDEFWECAIRTNTSPMNHLVGTCKMGPDSDIEAVVDSSLRVRGIRGLRVVDASIMPVIPTANTNAPTIMIAEKASDMIKQQWCDSGDRLPR